MNKINYELVDKAIIFATNAHKGQYRKNGAPYICHPLEVFSIICTITDDPVTMICGLLHDVVEDTDYTMDDIRREFGDEVADVLTYETEDKREGTPEEDTWLLRKQETLLGLKECHDVRVKMLWIGDKLSNIRSLHSLYFDEGDKVWNRFHEKDPKLQAWYYLSVLEYTKILAPSPAYREYEKLTHEVFDNYIK